MIYNHDTALTEVKPAAARAELGFTNPPSSSTNPLKFFGANSNLTVVPTLNRSNNIFITVVTAGEPLGHLWNLGHAP